MLESPQTLGQQILQIALNSSDPQTLLSRIARQIGEAFNVETCLVVAAVDRGAGALVGFWQAGTSVVLASEVKMRLLSLVEGARASAFAIADLHANSSPPQLSGLADLVSARAWLSQPMGEGDSSRGPVALGRSRPYQWSQDEREALKTIASQVAMACDRASLQQQVQIRNRYQVLVRHLSELLRNPTDLEHALESALAETALTLQVDRGWVMTLKYADPLQKNRSSKKLPKAKVTAIAHWSLQSETENSRSSPTFALADCSLCARSWQNAPTPLAVADCDRLSAAEALLTPPLLARPEMAAWAIVPLMRRAGNESEPLLTIGLLVLQARHPRTWQQEELDLLGWVGEQLSTAMLQNQAQRQVQSLVEERTAQLRWSLELQAKLSEKMRNQIDELKRANQIKDEFLATVQDELKHPLAKMKMSIEMLKIAPDPERRQRYLDILATECAKETKLIVDLLTLQQLRSQQFSSDRQQLDIRDIINSLARTFEQRWADKGLNLAVDYQLEINSPQDDDASPLLYTDSNSLNRILLELLSNAGKFAKPNTAVSLSVILQIDKGGKRMILTVTNIGEGLSLEEQGNIFKPFTQIRRREGTEQGTGLGLALVRSLVNHLNGTIEVSSIPSDSSSAFVTSFIVTLPQSQPPQAWEGE
ncbi:MAG: GAF domain-containing sensor histidine kinase [Cyanobacteriota bacterium]|nr:GAF domain-containing sensor histidine kinase [Cyanobacteriota bacterium]